MDLVGRGQAQYYDKDYLGTIVSFEQAYDLLPPSSQRLLLGPLGHSHLEAYFVNHDVLHLRKAQELLTMHLESLGESNQKARAETEGSLAVISDEFERVVREFNERSNKLVEQAAAKATKIAENKSGRMLLYFGIGGAVIGSGLIAISPFAEISQEPNPYYGSYGGGDEPPPETNVAKNRRRAFAIILSAGSVVTIASTVMMILGARKIRKSKSKRTSRLDRGGAVHF